MNLRSNMSFRVIPIIELITRQLERIREPPDDAPHPPAKCLVIIGL